MSDPWLDEFEQRIKQRQTADRSFTLLGETLEVKSSVAPQIGLAFNDARNKVIADQIARARATEAGEDTPAATMPDSELLDIMEATIRACLDPESIPTWETLRSPDHPTPMNWSDIFSFCDYVLAKATNLPTVASDASSNGRAKDAASSKDASPSRAATRRR